MPSSTAVVATDRAGRYIKQLCTHFAKKADSEFDDATGRTVFEFGVCDYRAEADALHLTVTGETEELLGRTEYVVGDHLTRFGVRDGLSVEWTRAAAGEQSRNEQGLEEQGRNLPGREEQS